MKMIKSLCLIPEIWCDNNCQYCYTKKQEFNECLSIEKYIDEISKVQLKINFDEILLDYNGIESEKNINHILKSLNHDDITITTTPTAALNLYTYLNNNEKYNINYNISIHNNEDIVLLNYLNNIKLNINYISVMVNDINLISIKIKNKKYLLFNKFSDIWKNIDSSILYHNLIKYMNNNVFDYDIDNCLTTQITDQECPAYTQLNLYRDGLYRRCPYSKIGYNLEYILSDTVSEQYKKGCYLHGK